MSAMLLRASKAPGKLSGSIFGNRGSSGQFNPLWPALLPLLFCCGCASPAGAPARVSARSEERPVLAVSSFENRSGFAGQWRLGGGMADLLVSELAYDGRFTVVERQHLESVVGEIRRQAGGLFRPEGRIEAGRLKNAEFLIRGVVNDFDHVSGGALRLATRRLIFGGKAHRARVAMTLTLVDVSSGQIIHSVYCSGTAAARDAAIGGEYENVAFGGDVFFRTPLGRATRNAMRAGIHEIVRAIPERTWQAMIADVGENGVFINGGRDRGIRTGAVFEVLRPGHPVIDPVTGDILGRITGETVGRIRVRAVLERMSVADPLDGAGFARGQILRREH